MNNKKESTIQKNIIEYLSFHSLKNHFFFFSILNESFMMAAMIAGMDKKQCAILINHLKSMGMVTGMPDLCIVKNGKTYFFELKKEDGVTSEIQKIIHERLIKTGNYVNVIRSLDNLIFFLKQYGIID